MKNTLQNSVVALLRLITITALVSLMGDAQEFGTLRGVVLDKAGSQFPGVLVEVIAPPSTDAMHRTTSSDTGAWQIEGIAPGKYLLRLSAVGFRLKSVAVSVRGSGITDTGAIRLGVGDCGEPGVTCDDFGGLKGSFQIPCVKGLDLLRDDSGKVKFLDSDDLARRSVRRQTPKWPKGAQDGDSVSVVVVIGAVGEVLCAEVSGQHTPIAIAAITAARQWRFRPSSKDGRAIASMGVLDFEVRTGR